MMHRLAKINTSIHIFWQTCDFWCIPYCCLKITGSQFPSRGDEIIHNAHPNYDMVTNRHCDIKFKFNIFKITVISEE